LDVGATGIFGRAGVVREIWKRRLHLIPVATTVFILFLALQNVVTFEGRYRKPLEPLLLLNLIWIVGARQELYKAALVLPAKLPLTPKLI
jgi:hypothetical protein